MWNWTSVRRKFYYVVLITLIGILSPVTWIFLEKYWIRKFSYYRRFKFWNDWIRFCKTYHLHNLIKDPTFFKSPDKSSCINLILTNFPKPFLKSQTLESGWSHLHKLTLILQIFIHNFFIFLVSTQWLRKGTSELARKILRTKNLIKQSWLGITLVLNFWNSKLKKTDLYMLSNATIV